MNKIIPLKPDANSHETTVPIVICVWKSMDVSIAKSAIMGEWNSTNAFMAMLCKTCVVMPRLPS